MTEVFVKQPLALPGSAKDILKRASLNKQYLGVLLFIIQSACISIEAWEAGRLGGRLLPVSQLYMREWCPAGSEGSSWNITRFEIRGKSQFHGQNRVQRFHNNIYIVNFWSGNSVQQKCVN